MTIHRASLRHRVNERTGPTHVIALCTCGWSHTQSRKQNALARAAKIRAAVARHLKDVAQKEAKA